MAGGHALSQVSRTSRATTTYAYPNDIQHKAHDRASGKQWLPVHPAWLAIAGILLTLVAILVWTFIVW